jgi:hypothetical protein
MVKPSIKKLKTTLYYSFMTLALLLPASLSSAAAAGTAYFSLTPNSGSFNVGDYLTLEIDVNSGSNNVNFAEADLTYDKNLLTFIGLDSAQSDFPATIQEVGGGGVVKVARGVLSDNQSGTVGYVNGTKMLSMATFKIAAAGNTAISFDTTSGINALTNNNTSVAPVWNGVTTGANFTFKAPVTQTPPPSGGGSGSGGTSSSGGSSSSPGSTTVTKTPTKPGTSTTAPTTSTTLPIQTGNNDSDTPQVLTPTLHMVSIKVVNSNGKPIVDAEVRMAGQSMHTISDGTVGFLSIADGNYTVGVTYKGKTTEKQITVNAQGQPIGNIQNFEVKLSSSRALPTWASYSAIGLAILFIVAFFIPRKRYKRTNHFPVNLVDPASVVVGGSKAPVAPPVATAVPTPPPAPVAKPQAPKAQTPVTPGTWFTPDGTAGNGQNSNLNKDQK